jgi:hypothetical protein
MLRAILVAIGALAVICGVVSLATGAFPPAVVFGFWGAVLLIGVLAERVVYKPIGRGRPGPGFQRTSERFVDEATGKTVTVFIDPSTGERAYVQD